MDGGKLRHGAPADKIVVASTVSSGVELKELPRCVDEEV